MKNKKGFTLIELLGVIIILGILLSLAVGAYSSYLTKTKLKTFKIEEKSMINAVKDAYTDCSSNHPNKAFCKNHQELDTIEESELIYLKELIEDDYIKIIKSPYDIEQSCDSEKSYVEISNNDGITYKVCLVCGDKKSKDCLE